MLIKVLFEAQAFLVDRIPSLKKGVEKESLKWKMALVSNFQKLRGYHILRGTYILRGPSTFLYIDIIAAALLLIYFQVDQSFYTLLEENWKIFACRVSFEFYFSCPVQFFVISLMSLSFPDFHILLRLAWG